MLANVALRVTQANGAYTAHVRVLNAGGCEQQDQGLDFAVSKDAAGNYVSPIENFQFADGSVKTFNDLLIKTQIVVGGPWQSITTGRNDDIILAGSGGNVVYSGSGNDIIFAGSGGDRVYGEGGNDYLQGNTGNDFLDGGCGTDILAGSNGKDTLQDMGGNNGFFGGAQDDVIWAGGGNDFIAGGAQDDLIRAGGGRNVIAFNGGDGRDTLFAESNATNTLSLGASIDLRNVALQKSASDLILKMGGADQITLKDWYVSGANQNVAVLQTVATVPFGTTSPASPTGWDFDAYDFKALVAKFNAAMIANPKLSQWAIMNGLLDTHLSSSDSAVLGGELAARYGAGGDTAISLGMAQDTLRDARFGAEAQGVASRFNSSVANYNLY